MSTYSTLSDFRTAMFEFEHDADFQVRTPKYLLPSKIDILSDDFFSYEFDDLMHFLANIEGFVANESLEILESDWFYAVNDYYLDINIYPSPEKSHCFRLVAYPYDTEQPNLTDFKNIVFVAEIPTTVLQEIFANLSANAPA